MAPTSMQRISGTDGTDFRHRQRVAGHYQNSVFYKSCLKAILFLHFLALILMWLKVGGELLTHELSFNWDYYSSLDLPNAYPWEYVWSLSFIPIMLGLASFRHNKVRLLRLHYYGQFVFGILPCAIGFGSLFRELIDYIRDMENSNTPSLRGTVPLVVLWLTLMEFSSLSSTIKYGNACCHVICYYLHNLLNMNVFSSHSVQKRRHAV